MPQLNELGLRKRQKAPVLVRVVDVCSGHPWTVVAVVVLLCAAMLQFVTGHFAMTTDTGALLSHELPWRIRQAAFQSAFPPESSDIVVVVDGQTAEAAEDGAAKLAAELQTQKGLFRQVQRPDGGPFWAHNRLLYATVPEVKSALAELLKAQPFLGAMASDPTLRGLANTLSLTAEGLDKGDTDPERLRVPFRTLADALHDSAVGKTALFSWRTLITGEKPDSRELRRLILINPVLDFTSMLPGEKPTSAIRTAAKKLNLDGAHGVSVRLTGAVPLQDEEFAALAERADLIAILATVAVVVMLWLAVRSPWLIAAILTTTLVGLLTATAVGLALFHEFNVISVAFIPLFVGLGIDFGIQFSVRYRAVRGRRGDLRHSLKETARTMGAPLTLAAVAIALGFLAFGPTAYHGVSQLGVIAGLGLVAALALNLTLLPALITLTRAPGAPPRPPSAELTGVDRFILGRRKQVVRAAVLLAALFAVLLPFLRFDFNPLHLRSSATESVATMLDLARDPDQAPNTLEVIRPDLAQADQLAATFRRDPTVHDARTLSSFIPAQQDEKIALIEDAANLVDLTLNPLDVAEPPTDAQIAAALERAATKLRQARTPDAALAADARRLADELDRTARGNRAARERAANLLVPGFLTTLQQTRDLLHPEKVSVANLPPELIREWLTPDGRARVSVLPKGDSNNDAVLARFIAAGTRIAPDVTGAAVYLQESGNAMVGAFAEAGVLSFIVICALLLATLRRVRDVAITMAPIVLTGLATMGSCVVIGQPINYANIIALPLLVGIGVAFHIYFVMAWRSGSSHLLTSSLARAVFFSALATATGFGSLWASSHPGTASMGKLLMISLLWTLVSALLFQPALMGPGAASRSPYRAISS